jgi:hypothetical protein
MWVQDRVDILENSGPVLVALQPVPVQVLPNLRDRVQDVVDERTPALPVSGIAQNLRAHVTGEQGWKHRAYLLPRHQSLHRVLDPLDAIPKGRGQGLAALTRLGCDLGQRLLLRYDEHDETGGYIVHRHLPTVLRSPTPRLGQRARWPDRWHRTGSLCSSLVQTATEPRRATASPTDRS